VYPDGPNEVSRNRPTRKTPIIGLAGGIGAGKTSVGQILESLGAALIDFDRLAHEALREPEVISVLRSWWGGSICTPQGDVDHRAVADIVFHNPQELSRLEGLLHPMILRRFEALEAAHASDPAVRAIVLDAPKLFESGLDRFCDTVIFVEADRARRVERVARARGWSEEELTSRENLQNPLDRKKASADHVVTNHSGIDALRLQVERVFSSVLAACA
jgi:dephospho-CoA kinase